MPAASAAVRPLLTGPLRPALVLAATPAAIYLHLDAVDGDAVGGHDPAGDVSAAVLGVLAPRAVRVPVGVLMDAAAFAALGALRPGGAASVGAGGLRLAGLDLRVTRWWDARVPVVSGLLELDCASALPPPGVPPDLTVPAGQLARWIRDPAPAAAAGVVRALVGLGAGLTPAGDDVLCGALATLAAVGPVARLRRELLARQVRAQAGRTTTLSAALLRCAADGCAIPELTGLLRALPGGGTGPARSLVALARVGHSSGPALAHGALVTVAALAATRRRRAVAA